MARVTMPFVEPWRRGLPVGLLIAAFGLILIGTAWLDTLHRAATDREAEIARINRENDALARAIVEHARRVLRDADTLLLTLKREYEDAGGVTQEIAGLVERGTDDPSLNQVALADSRGNLVLSALPLDGPVNIAANETFRVQAAREDVGLHFAAPERTGPATRSFFLSRRLQRADGTFAGLVFAGLDPEYFARSYEELSLAADHDLLLVGRDGIVRAQRLRRLAEIGRDLSASPMFARLPREPIGHFEENGIFDGERRFVSYHALPDFPLVVVVSDLSASALAPFERQAAAARRTTLFFTLFVAASCLGLILADRRTQRRSAELAAELVERRRAEAALNESQDLFAGFLEHIPAAVFVQDLKGRVLYSNQAYRELPGREAIGRYSRELLAPSAGGAGTVLRGRSVTFDEPIDDGAGGKRIFETRMFVVDRSGAEPLLGCISMDGTGRRNAEVERLTLERRMQQAQKLESLGVLAGGIAHDFNNLLLVILGNADLALSKAPPESPLRPFLSNIETSAQRAADLTNQMLAYSGKGRFVIEPINLSRLVQEMGHLLGTVISKRAGVVYRLAPDLPPVDADATQIRQVVMNLITNASDALGGSGGTITVRTRVEEIATGTPVNGQFDHPLPPGRYAVVEVEDSGCGMDDETLGRIFDPFFTTKEAGRGLGLASVLGIVRGHQGGIRVQSSPGRGTTFSVLLPVATSAAAPGAAGQKPAAPKPQELPRVRVLVVDDEETVRQTARVMLEECGFEVVTAADGAEGVRVFREQGGRVGAVLLDMTMPRMGGKETFHEVRRIDPGVPVLIMSGFDERETVAHLEGHGLTGFIQKPYRMQALLAKLREVIGLAGPPA